MNPIIPSELLPNELPIPNTTASVAPKEAPEETPNIYGSANGFLTIACITIPTTDNPTPTAIANTILGILISHTTSATAPVPIYESPIFNNLYSIT